MLESQKEFVSLETNLSSASSKRSPFHLLSSLFGKKKANSLDNDKPSEYQTCSSNDVYAKLQMESRPKRCSTTPGTLEDYSLDFSPSINAKRKNLKIELENLHLSRQDNPYLKQLERFNDTILTCEDFNSLAERALLQSEWHLEAENDADIHQHLVRSPPPQFPQNVSHFMYSQACSPKKNAPSEEDKLRKTLNPVQCKKETAVLDPSIREVLEYQKSQLIAGIQHSLYMGQDQLGTAHYSGATSSLPGLTSCSLEMDCRRTALGPIRIGRTLSDSICHENKIRKMG